MIGATIYYIACKQNHKTSHDGHFFPIQSFDNLVRQTIRFDNQFIQCRSVSKSKEKVEIISHFRNVNREELIVIENVFSRTSSTSECFTIDSCKYSIEKMFFLFFSFVCEKVWLDLRSYVTERNENEKKFTENPNK